MPYRNAHWPILALLPTIVLAFWPGYFGHLRDAPLALHGHGISASVWLMLLACQLWSIHARRPGLHRAAGMALFVVVPVFAGATLAAVQGGFALFVAQADPFHAAFGARLGAVDLIALCTLVGLVRHALVERRHVRTHASAMLATALLVLPPILGRLVPIVPGFGTMDIAGWQGFALAFQIAQAVSILASLGLYLADRRARAFAVVAASIAVQSLVFEALGASSTWGAIATRMAGVPTLPLALIGAGGAAVALWQGWARTPPRRRFRIPPIGARPAA